MTPPIITPEQLGIQEPEGVMQILDELEAEYKEAKEKAVYYANLCYDLMHQMPSSYYTNTRIFEGGLRITFGAKFGCRFHRLASYTISKAGVVTLHKYN